MTIRENKFISQALSGLTILFVVSGLTFPLIKVTIGDQSTTITSSNINEDISFLINDLDLDVRLYLLIALVISLLIFGSTIIPQFSDYFKYSGFAALATGMFIFLALDEVNDYVTFLEFAVGLLSTFTTVSVERGLGYFSIAGALITSIVYSIFVSYQQYLVNRESSPT